MVMEIVGNGNEVLVAVDGDDGGSGILSDCSHHAIILAFIVFSNIIRQQLALILLLNKSVHTCL